MFIVIYCHILCVCVTVNNDSKSNDSKIDGKSDTFTPDRQLSELELRVVPLSLNNICNVFTPLISYMLRNTPWKSFNDLMVNITTHTSTPIQFLFVLGCCSGEWLFDYL